MKIIYSIALFLSITVASTAQDFWRTFNSSNVPELKGISTIKVINDTLAFIVVTDGILIYTNNTFNLKTSSNSNLPPSKFKSIAVNKTHVWLDFEEHFAEWNGTDFNVYPKQGNAYSMKAVDLNNRPWFKSSNSFVYIFDGTSFVEGPIQPIQQIYCLRNGALICFTSATITNGIARVAFIYDGISIKHIEYDTAQISYYPYLYDKSSLTFNNNLYIANNHSVHKIDASGNVSIYMNEEFNYDKMRDLIPIEENSTCTFFTMLASSRYYNLVRKKGVTSTYFKSILNEQNHNSYLGSTILSETKIWIFNSTNLVVGNYDFNPLSTSHVLGINSIRAKFSASNTYFNPLTDVITDTERFSIEGEPDVNCFNASSLWIGGINENGDTLVSKNYGVQNDFSAGRINNQNGLIEKPIFKLTKNEIERHKLLYNKVGYEMPKDIAQWPGNGNTLLGQFPDAAPFYDMNRNGVYEPQLGDYPFILGDQAICWFTNDKNSTANARNCNTMGIEIFNMAFGFDAPNNEALNQTIFLRSTIINRSGQVFDDVKIGLFNDFDIGNPNDDFTGCDTIDGIGFAYNGDAYDENFSYGPGFGEHIPAIGIKFISHPLHSSRIFDKNLTFNPYNRNQNTIKCYDVLQNISSSNSSQPNFDYWGDPVSNTGITEINAGKVTGERKNFMITKIDRFVENERIDFDIVIGYGFAPQNSNGYREGITIMKNNLNNAADYFSSMPIDYNYLTWVGNEEIQIKPSVSIYPNPTNGSITVLSEHSIENITLCTITGQIVYQKTCNQNNSFQLSLEHFESGIYLLKITENDGKQTVKKIVKQ